MPSMPAAAIEISSKAIAPNGRMPPSEKVEQRLLGKGLEHPPGKPAMTLPVIPQEPGVDADGRRGRGHGDLQSNDGGRMNNDANMALDDPSAARDSASLLRLHAVTLFVEDRGASVRFFVDALGFALLSGGGGPGEPSWVAVAPPDGTALLSLVERPGQMSAADAPPIVLLTNDVPARYEAWRRRGVHFSQPPVSGAWGGAHAVFEDPDGHVFTLASVDPLTRELDAARRSTAEREERERRAAYDLRLAAEVQARLLPYAPRRCGSSTTPALAGRRAASGATTTTSCASGRNGWPWCSRTFRAKGCPRPCSWRACRRTCGPPASSGPGIRPACSRA